MEVIKHLFELISKQDSQMMRIFFAWINYTSHEQMNRVAPS
jgi:hypothetical protein